MSKTKNLFLLLNTLNLLDCITTFTAINYLGAVELNPFMAWLIGLGWKYFILGKIIYVVLLSYHLLKANARKSFYFCVAVYTFVVSYNLSRIVFLLLG